MEPRENYWKTLELAMKQAIEEWASLVAPDGEDSQAPWGLPYRTFAGDDFKKEGERIRKTFGSPIEAVAGFLNSIKPYVWQQKISWRVYPRIHSSGTGWGEGHFTHDGTYFVRCRICADFDVAHVTE